MPSPARRGGVFGSPLAQTRRASGVGTGADTPEEGAGTGLTQFGAAAAAHEGGGRSAPKLGVRRAHAGSARCSSSGGGGDDDDSEADDEDDEVDLLACKCDYGIEGSRGAFIDGATTFAVGARFELCRSLPAPVQRSNRGARVCSRSCSGIARKKWLYTRRKRRAAWPPSRFLCVRLSIRRRGCVRELVRRGQGRGSSRRDRRGVRAWRRGRCGRRGALAVRCCPLDRPGIWGFFSSCCADGISSLARGSHGPDACRGGGGGGARPG